MGDSIICVVFGRDFVSDSIICVVFGRDFVSDFNVCVVFGNCLPQNKTGGVQFLVKL